MARSRGKNRAVDSLTEFDDLWDKIQWPSVRAVNFVCIINLTDQRRSSLSRSEHPPFSSKVDSTFNDRYAVANFRSPDFSKQFQTEVPLFL